jgi:hypothetical protein
MNYFGKWLIKIIKTLFDELACAGEVMEIGRFDYEQRH